MKMSKLLQQATWGYFLQCANKDNMALPNSSIGTLKSLKRQIYILTKTQHKIAFFCFILHLSSLCGAQVGINKIAYLHCVYCKVKTRIQGEECHNPRSRCASVWKYVDQNAPLFDKISLYFILFETWLLYIFLLSFFSKQWTFICPSFFSFFLNSLVSHLLNHTQREIF